ncbi:MAG: ATP-dependent helicase [Planctomycetota bacterium]|nr:MAG: ATP-dependent helicase [Planctomycetota bacterium]
MPASGVGDTLHEALAGLSDDQARAVRHEGGPALVIAGPGAGKTRVIVTRVARLVAPADAGGLGADPESVLALAFTNKSAGEMRDRLVGLVGPSRAARVRVQTCNAFGRGVIRRFGDLAGLPADSTLMDSAQRRRLLREILVDHGAFRDRAAEGLDAAADRAWACIDACTTDGVSPRDALAWCDAETAALSSPDPGADARAADARRARLEEFRPLAEVYAEFDARRLAAGLLLFDDDVNLAARLIREHDLCRAILRDETRHIVVDEFQDWSPAQIALLSLLAPADAARPPDLFVVGDDDQAIYAFRGADDRALERFARAWPDHAEILLTGNYRSGERIIAASNAMIARAGERYRPDKSIRVADGSAAEQPGAVEALELPSRADLPRAVAALILADRAGTGRAWSDYAVIVRTHDRADEIALGLAAYDAPVRSSRTPAPIDDAAVKDLFAWARLLADPGHTPSLQRLLVRPPVSLDPDAAADVVRGARARPRTDAGALGAARAAAERHPAVADFVARYDALARFAAEHDALAALRRIVDDARLLHVEALDAESRARRVEAVVGALRFAQDKQPRLEPPGDLRAFLRHFDALDPKEQTLRLTDDGADDPPDEDADGVAVLTAHAAKGLEFDTVIVADVRIRTGFPSLERAPDRLALPEALTGRARASHDDEERRLFYVACTRARRRLTLVAKSIKRPPKAGDFFDELTRLDPPEGLARLDLNDLYERAGVTATDGAGLGADAARRARVRRELDRARADALAALHRAERADLDAGAIDAIARDLDDAARRIAALAHLRDAGALPDHLGHPAAEALARRLERDAKPALAPLPAPLKLTYTKINDYTRCPRCFYVKHVLGLDEEKTPGLAAGDLAHRALEQFFGEVRHAEAHGEPAPGEARLREIVRRLVGPAGRLDGPDGALGAQIEALALAAVRDLHDPASEVLEVERTIEFPLGLPAGEHNAIAKVDRIDRTPDGAYRLVDYKTGAPSKRLTEPKPDDLQFCLYALALRRFYEIPDGEPLAGVAEYWLLRTGLRGSIALDELDIGKALAVVNTTAEGMLAGRFERSKACRRAGDWLCSILPEEA